MKDKIIELCVNIYAHSELDKEIVLGGNGANSFDAGIVADAILDLLEIPYREISDLVNKRVKELE